MSHQGFTRVPTVERLYRKSQLSYATEGGFLADDDEHSPPKRRREESPTPDDGDTVDNATCSYDDFPVCQDCDKEFPFSYLCEKFDLNVCDTCRKPETVHKLVTRTEAKSAYLLKDCDLDSRRPILRFVSKKNPHNPRWGDMKLYLLLQIEKRAIDVWGSMEGLEEAKQVKDERKEKIQEKQTEKRIAELRREVRGVSSNRRTAKAKPSPHKHTFAAEQRVAGSDTYSQTCTGCQYTLTYEKM